MAHAGDSPNSVAPARAAAAAILATLVSVLPAFLLGGVAVQVRGELGFSESRLGFLVTAFFAVSAIGSAPAGRLTERLGPRRVMVLVSLTAMTSLVTVGLAPNWSWLLLGMAIGALANAAAQPAANVSLARGIPPGHQGLAFGLKQGSVPLTTLLGGLAVPTVALTVGWRWAFGAAAILALILMAVAPRDVDRPALRGSSREIPRVAGGSRRVLLMLTVAAFLGNFASNSLGVFLVESLVDRGTAEGFAGLVLMAGSAIGVAARIGVGWWSDRSPQPLFFATVGLMMIVGAIGYLALASGREWLTIPAVAIVFGAGWGWNGLFSFSVVTAFREAPAAATGITHTGLFFGAMAGPGVFGLVAEYVSFNAGWLMFGIVLLAAGSLMAASGRAVARRRPDLTTPGVATWRPRPEDLGP